MFHLIDYVWCVEKFSQYFELHEQEVYPLLTSPIFAYKNTRWVLNLYPEGLGDSASQGYISLFIKYVSEDPETINAKVELSLLNNKNERVYCRDTGDHQYQTFIDFGYKQFLKIQDIKEQKDDLIFNGQLKIFARVEFEHATLPSSLTWSNYDLLLFKENFKDLYETKNLCDIIIKVVKKPVNNQQNLPYKVNINSPTQNYHSNVQLMTPIQNSSNHYHPYSISRMDGNQHHSKLKRPGNNNGKSLNGISHSYFSDAISNQDVHSSIFSDFFSSLSSVSQQTLKECSMNSGNESSQESTLNSNSILLNKHKVDTNNNNYILEFEMQEIKAHKFILASRSGKFRELLKTNLIKLCKLNDLPVSCDQCNKISQNSGCSSINCLYKNNKPNRVDESINHSNNQNALFQNPETSASKASEILCSSSYPSCSATSSSSASNDQDSCTCICTCSKPNVSFSSMPSSSFLSSSSSPEKTNQVCPIHDIDTSNLNPCAHLVKSAPKFLVTNEDSDISDLLIIETDRSPKVIEYLIRYMYTGYLDSLDTFSKDIYEISKEYKVHGLTNLAREHIIKELNIQNCCDYLVFCVVNNDYELNNKIQIFIAENYDTIVKTNAYKQAKRKYRELFENTFNEIFKKIPTLNKTQY